MRLLTLKQVASRLAVSTKTLRRWIDDGKFLAPMVLPGGLQRWEMGEVAGWLYRSQSDADGTQNARTPAVSPKAVKEKT